MKVLEIPTKDSKIIKETVELHGIDAQIDLMIEECAELIVALEKTRRKRGSSTEEKRVAVVDECADVFLMVNQMAYIFGMEDVQKRVHFKINRVFQRNELTRNSKATNN